MHIGLYAGQMRGWMSKVAVSEGEIWPRMGAVNGKGKASKRYYRWQIFYTACVELFAYEGGDTWGVLHYLFEKPEK